MSRRAAPITDVAFRARFSDGTVSRSYATIGPAKAAITSAQRSWDYWYDRAARQANRPRPEGVIERSSLVWEVTE